MVHDAPPANKWLVSYSYNHYKPNRKVFPWAFYMIIKNVVVGFMLVDL
jgi:hypothetical protein